MKQIQIIGHVGSDPKVEPKGDRHLLIFSVAVTERYNQDGEVIEKTEWFNCYRSYQKQPIELMKFFKQGLKVFVQGSISFSTSTKDSSIYLNKNINVTQFDVLTSKKDSESNNKKK